LRPIDFVTALAALLSQSELRTRFAQDPALVADELNIADGDRAMFIALQPEHVHAQANLLMTKRMKEVYKHLPQTYLQLGNDATTFFKSYAANNWPQTHRRHQEDAYQFCHYLKAHRLPVTQSEFNHLAFLRSGRHISLALAKDVLIKGHRFPAIQLFYRRKGITGQWRLYLKG